MTTIVWDGETLAADSRECDDYIEQHACVKLHTVKGSLIGLAGKSSSGVKFIEWMKGGETEDEKPDNLSGLCALVVRPDGSVFEVDENLIFIPAAKITAVGSGRGPALGALLAGASAVEAVRIAKKIDPNTGGPVRKLVLT